MKKCWGSHQNSVRTFAILWFFLGTFSLDICTEREDIKKNLRIGKRGAVVRSNGGEVSMFSVLNSRYRIYFSGNSTSPSFCALLAYLRISLTLMRLCVYRCHAWRHFHMLLEILFYSLGLEQDGIEQR